MYEQHHINKKNIKTFTLKFTLRTDSSSMVGRAGVVERPAVGERQGGVTLSPLTAASRAAL